LIQAEKSKPLTKYAATRYKSSQFSDFLFLFVMRFEPPRTDLTAISLKKCHVAYQISVRWRTNGKELLRQNTLHL